MQLCTNQQSCNSSGLRGSNPNEMQLPTSVKNYMETAFSTDLSDIRIRIGLAPIAFGALAMACGSTITFIPGTYNPTSIAGLHLLVHELTHVIQQRQRRLYYSAESILINEQELENEANKIADKLIQGQRLPAKIRGSKACEERSTNVQFQRWGWIGQNILEVGNLTDIGLQITEHAVVQYPPANNYPALFWDNLGGRGNNNVVCYHSTASVNETYQTRTDAWNRAMLLGSRVMGLNTAEDLGIPTAIYMRGLGDQNREGRITNNQIQSLFHRRTLLQNSDYTFLHWMRYTRADQGAHGYYYEFSHMNSRVNLLIVEHTEDIAAQLSHKNNVRSNWIALGTVRHFHVAIYRRDIEEDNAIADTGEDGNIVYRPANTYIPGYAKINSFGDKVGLGGIRTTDQGYEALTPYQIITETDTLDNRVGYEIYRLPSHHLYYLDA